ncbi:MAG TPA: preprotein translocase subunit SecG [Candidatus Cloacimonadota bacterium]|nr:preprotein translocase subunit SecG [Candidatus Cloacimonadota bacterium]
MLYTIALIIHTLICIGLVLVILAQTSKGGLDANLGGAAVNVFGGSGASEFLRKWTQILGLLFLASCILLAFLVKDVRKADFKDIQKRQRQLGQTEAPAKPAPVKQAPAPAPAPQGD